VKNLTVIAQFVYHFNPELLRDFFYPYLKQSNRDHIKQRSRLAPDRAVCVAKLDMINRIAGNTESRSASATG